MSWAIGCCVSRGDDRREDRESSNADLWFKNIAAPREPSNEERPVTPELSPKVQPQEEQGLSPKSFWLVLEKVMEFIDPPDPYQGDTSPCSPDGSNRRRRSFQANRDRQLRELSQNRSAMQMVGVPSRRNGKKLSVIKEVNEADYASRSLESYSRSSGRPTTLQGCGKAD